jgi:beta-ribofuranosylaminobenzene 5'-phosphate synthase
MIEVSVPSRIHVGLVGLSEGGYRINGGIGWALETPRLIVRAQASDVLQVRDVRRFGMTPMEVAGLQDLLKAQCLERAFNHMASVGISGETPAHRGLGGGTAARLAAIEALHLINESTLIPEILIAASKRGGTSGVGIRTYFEGGMVFDAGHTSGQRPRPSHAWDSPGRPLQLVRLDMPQWRFGICAPPWIQSLNHAQEKALFANTLPIPHSDVTETLYHMIYGVMAAVADQDLPTFTKAIDALQETAWKAAEWRGHGQALRDVADILRRSGAKGIGLSSVGPSLYFIAEDFQVAQLPREIAQAIVFTYPTNGGRIVNAGTRTHA